MSDFMPFDTEYEVDKSVLTEELPGYLTRSLRQWTSDVLINNKKISKNRNGIYVLDATAFLNPLQETFRRNFDEHPDMFLTKMFSDVKLFRNLMSYILQHTANLLEARDLEAILERSGSAYAVEFEKEPVPKQAIMSLNSPGYRIVRTKLVYRVAPIVKMQAEDVLRDSELLSEAWSYYYGVKPDDEKTVVRCVDALAGMIRDAYFPNENRPQLGTLLGKMRQKPNDYDLPASDLYDTDKFLEIMKDFSKIRGNHKSGTGRAPTHEEAAFVLHYTIMMFQLLRSKQ